MDYLKRSYDAQNPLRLIATIIACGVTVLLTATLWLACDCNTLSPAESFKAADLVFVGTVVASNDSGPGAGATFRVEEVLKGTTTDQVVIANGLTDCDFLFHRWNVYIVYARQSDGKFLASTCMSTKVIPTQQGFVRYTSPPRYGYRATVAVVILLLALSVGYIVGRASKRAK